MRKKEKKEIIESLARKFSTFDNFYVTNGTGLTVAAINELRRKCFEERIIYHVYKNTLIQKALEQWNSEVDYAEFSKSVFKGFSGIFFTKENANVPAKIIRSFIKNHKKGKLQLKGASINGDLFIGAEHLEILSKLKSKKELVGDIVTLIKTPMLNIIASMQCSQEQLMKVIKTLSEKDRKTKRENSIIN